MTTVRTSSTTLTTTVRYELHLTTVTLRMLESFPAARGAAHLGQVSPFEPAKPRKTVRSTRLPDEQA
jgi:hypothetical protein